jgi:hypothetical protein
MSRSSLGSVYTTWKYGTNVLQNICAVMCCRHLCAVRRKIAGLFSAYFVPQRT